MEAQRSSCPRYFAGLDAHLACVTVAVVTRGGEPVLEQRVAVKHPEQLVAALAPFHAAQHPLEAVVETCPFCRGPSGGPVGEGL